jgi:DNA gyrase subunit A
MSAEFLELSDKFGEERKTRIERGDDGELSDMDLIKNSRSVIVVLRSGYIKRMPLKDFESQSRGTRGKRGTTDVGNTNDDEVAHCFTCNDHDTLLMVTQRGIAFGIRAYQVPSASRTAKGQPIPSVLPVANDDTITAVLPVSEFSKDEYFVLATENGWIKKTALSAFENLSSRGLTIATLEPDDRLRWCHRCRDGDTILVGSNQGLATRFEANDLRPTGRTSRGVIAMRLRKGDRIADVNVLSGSDAKARESVLTITKQGFGKRVATTDFPINARGGRGVIAIKFKKDVEDHVSCLLAAQPDDEILLITSKGIMVRQKVANIPAQSRSATGVTIQRLDEGDHITQVSIVPKYEETDQA